MQLYVSMVGIRNLACQAAKDSTRTVVGCDRLLFPFDYDSDLATRIKTPGSTSLHGTVTDPQLRYS
jgi:hypothetical protein